MATLTLSFAKLPRPIRQAVTIAVRPGYTPESHLMEVYSGVLGVRKIQRGYSITHVPSGYRIMDVFATKPTLLKCLSILLSAPISNWSTTNIESLYHLTADVRKQAHDIAYAK